MTRLQRRLQALGACSDAVDWCGARTLRQAWDESPRADWLLWLAARMMSTSGWPTHQQIVLAACDCAATVQRYVPPGECRPAAAIAAARLWSAEPTRERQDSALAAGDAARSAAWAAWDATRAAGVAWDATENAAWAAGAAGAAAGDAWAAGDAALAAEAAAHCSMCNLIRSRLTIPDTLWTGHGPRRI